MVEGAIWRRKAQPRSTAKNKFPIKGISGVTQRSWTRWLPAIALGLALGLSLAPLFFLRTLPFTDLPNHLAEATIFKFRGDPTGTLTPYFTSVVSWYQPAVAHSVIASWFPSVEVGDRVLWIVYVLAVPLLVARIARQCGGDGAASALAVLLLWNHVTLWGFVGFTLSIPLGLLCLSLHLDHLQRRTWRSAAGVALAIVVTYWFHVLAAALVAFGYVLIEAWHMVKSRSCRPAGRRWLPLAPVVIQTVVWISRGQEFNASRDFSFLKAYYSEEYLNSLMTRLTGFVLRDWSGLAAAPYGSLFAVACAAVFLLPFGVCLRRLLRTKEPLTIPQTGTLVFTLAAALVYVVLPDRLPYQHIFYERFSVFIFLGIAATLTWALPRYLPRLPRMLPGLASMVYAALWFHYFLGFAAIDRDFCRAFPRSEEVRRSSMVTVLDNPEYRGRAVLIHYNNYQIIWNRSPAPTKAAEYRFGVIRRGRASLPPYETWLYWRKRQAEVERAMRKYMDMDYVLAQGERPAAVLRKRPDFVLVRETGDWRLFKKLDPPAPGGEPND